MLARRGDLGGSPFEAVIGRSVLSTAIDERFSGLRLAFHDEVDGIRFSAFTG
jgi:hypothetical protein